MAVEKKGRVPKTVGIPLSKYELFERAVALEGVSEHAFMIGAVLEKAEAVVAAADAAPVEAGAPVHSGHRGPSSLPSLETTTGAES